MILPYEKFENILQTSILNEEMLPFLAVMLKAFTPLLPLFDKR